MPAIDSPKPKILVELSHEQFEALKVLFPQIATPAVPIKKNNPAARRKTRARMLLEAYWKKKYPFHK